MTDNICTILYSASLVAWKFDWYDAESFRHFTIVTLELRVYKLNKSRNISAIPFEVIVAGLSHCSSRFPLCARVWSVFGKGTKGAERGQKKRRMRELKGGIVRRISTKNASGLISRPRRAVAPVTKNNNYPGRFVPLQQYCGAEILFRNALRRAYVTYFEPVSIVEPLVARTRRFSRRSRRILGTPFARRVNFVYL